MMMKSNKNLVVAILACLSTLSTLTSGFLYSPQAHENLASLTQNIDTEQLLQLKLDVGLSIREQQQQQLYGNEARLALQGPLLKLLTTSPPTKAAVPLPGATQAKQVSTGCLGLDVVEPASYISLQGKQDVVMQKACWEMIWMHDQEHGKFTCAFDLPLPVHRNGVTLPAGPLYITFGIYTIETLAAAQVRKRTTMQRYNALLQEKQEELAKSNAASNPIQKAIHYQRAFAALDHMIMLPTVSHIPEHSQVVPMAGLLVVQEGVVWRKTAAHWGGLIGPSSERVGKAMVSTLKPNNNSNNNNKEDDNRRRRLSP